MARVKIMSSITSTAIIEKLRDMFSHCGLPDQLVSDNGSQFTSNEFSQFMLLTGVISAFSSGTVSSALKRAS